MPTRVIDSEIWEDEWFGTLSFFEQSLWVGLFSRCADCQGRMLDNVALIRSKLWPYQDVSLESINLALAGFHEAHKVQRYTAGSKSCIQVLRWWRYQYPRFASASDLPAPQGWRDHVRTSGEGGVLEKDWGTRESRIAYESVYLTALRDRNPLQEPAIEPSDSDSINESESERMVTPSSARVADNAAPAAPEGSSDSDAIKRKAYDLAALVAPENAYKQLTRILDVIEHVPRGDWLARMEMAGARIREMQAGHAIRNGDGIKHVLDILRE